jgi:hypothetical protein
MTRREFFRSLFSLSVSSKFVKIKSENQNLTGCPSLRSG